MSKTRSHVAADARVTSGALYLQGLRRVFRGLGLGFQGLEFKQPRSCSSATPYTHPEAPRKKKKIPEHRSRLLIICLRVLRHRRCYTTLLTSFQNVTITWYRLSRSKVYLSHTLSTFLTSRTMACRYTLLTFLTQLNQERWSSATYLSTFLTPLNQERSCTHTYIPRLCRPPRGRIFTPQDHTDDSTSGELLLPKVFNIYLRRYLYLLKINNRVSPRGRPHARENKCEN